MDARSTTTLFLAIALGTSANVQAQSHHYVYDDGTADTALSYAFDADMCWVQSFQTVGATDTIVSIETAVGPAGQLPPDVPNGTTITLYVWEDPNDDGEPSDAVLLSLATGTVQNSGTGLPATYTVPAATVHGRFFVGAMVPVAGGLSAAPMDLQTPAAGRAYFAIGDPQGSFDPLHFSNNFYGHVETLAAFLNHCWVLRANGSAPAPSTYCFAKVNSAGCTPQVTWGGTPSISAGSGFTLFATNLLNHRRGFLLYGTAGQDLAPFGGGFLCVAQPFRRTRGTNTGGTTGASNCTGTMSFDFNQWVASGADPSLTLGTVVDAQFYYRDPFFSAPNDVGLTGGVHFTLGL